MCTLHSSLYSSIPACKVDSPLSCSASPLSVQQAVGCWFLFHVSNDNILFCLFSTSSLSNDSWHFWHFGNGQSVSRRLELARKHKEGAKAMSKGNNKTCALHLNLASDWLRKSVEKKCDELQSVPIGLIEWLSLEGHQSLILPLISGTSFFSLTNREAWILKIGWIFGTFENPDSPNGPLSC